MVGAASLGALGKVGLPTDELEVWDRARPVLPMPEAASRAELPKDIRLCERYYALGDALLHRLPPKPGRLPREREAADAIKECLRETRTRFTRAYAPFIYVELTHDYRTFLRVDELVYAAADRYPGLVPSRAVLEAERDLPLKDKEGVEVDQGIFLSKILAHERAGAHLVHAMLRPRGDSVERLEHYRHTGRADLGTAVVERRGPAGHLYLKNTRFLNAEDDTTTHAMEIGVDLVLLDSLVEVGVLRGAPVEHPKHAGRRIFNAGLNLTHLYYGKLSYLFFMTRDMGFVNKLYRGLSGPEFRPGGPESTIEKPWIGAVDAFAIGGGCQLLLVLDYVIAEERAYFNLPARKEGIIPGAANLRLPRFVGDRKAREGIMFDRQFPADGPEGRTLCNMVVPASEMDAAIEAAVDALTGSGLVSAEANRKALRVGQEPLATFQAYMALYAREQANCHLSPALVSNLERHWKARRRRL